MASQLLETLREAELLEVSEAHRALEHVLEVVSLGAALAERFSKPLSKHESEETPEVLSAQAPVATLANGVTQAALAEPFSKCLSKHESEEHLEVLSAQAPVVTLANRVRGTAPTEPFSEHVSKHESEETSEVLPAQALVATLANGVTGAAPAEPFSEPLSKHESEEPLGVLPAQALVATLADGVTGAALAEPFSEPLSKPESEETLEELFAQAPVAILANRVGCWRSKGDLRWAQVELRQALVCVSCESSDGTRTVSRQAIESWLDTSAAHRIRSFHLEEGCRRAAELIKEQQTPGLECFIERVLYEANICHAQFSDFRDAEQDEIQDMPKVYVAFRAFLNDECPGPTARSFLTAFGKVFKYDGKAPAEMATLAYIDCVRHTYENALSNNVMGSSLSKFSLFWQRFGGRPFVGDVDASGVQLIPCSLNRRKPEDGDGSESARQVDLLPDGWRVGIGSIPEGWRVHSARGRTLAWTSPAGEWHMKKSELVRRLAVPPPPPLFHELPSDPERLLPPATPEKTLRRPEKEKMTFLPLSELLHPLPKLGKRLTTTERDLKLLPRVITTFMRMGNGRMEHREVTRKGHAMTLFKLASESQRSFEALADPSFLELVGKCAENRRNHGAYMSAMRAFQEFWSHIGGYEGEFDAADREIMQRSLHVKPSFVDAPGECGHGGICGSNLCRWSKRWCETCGTLLRCGKHEEHSKETCREIFWSKHHADGTPVRTIADFFGTKVAKKAAPGLRPVA